jgi:type I restriction enzyme M protein
VAGRWGDAEIRLAAQFTRLHQLIYTHGGISPTNAALEEVAKLVFLRLWSIREPDAAFGVHGRAADLFDPESFGRLGTTDFKQAFASALRSSTLQCMRSDGTLDPLWPHDEPFRLDNDHVLARAVDLVRATVDHDCVSVADPLGTAFDALLCGRYDHAGGLGTYLTPSAVARMMAEIAVELVVATGPVITDVGFGDPFCGTGRFLVALLEVLSADPRPAARAVVEAGVFGTDHSSAAVAKARLNLLLYGVDRPRAWVVEDSVVDPALDRWLGRIPVILTNPPFGENKYADPEGIRRTGLAIGSLAQAQRVDPALACLVRSLQLLAPDGVLGIVLPNGVIESRAFNELIAARTGSLAGQVSVAANISLPTATFSLSGTVAKTSAVFLRRTDRIDRVMLARVEHVGFIRQAGRATADPGGNELPTVSTIFKESYPGGGDTTLLIASTEPLVAIAAAESLQSLDPARLDPDALRVRQTLRDHGGVELRELLCARRPRRSRSADIRPFVSVLHVDGLGNIDWDEAATYAPTTPGILVSGGDLIVSLLNPAKLRAAVIPDNLDTVQVSAEFGTFSARHSPYAILALLYSDAVRCQLTPLGRGTSSSRRRIEPADVLSLVVPNLDDQTLRSLNGRVRDAYETVAKGRRSLTTLTAEVADLGPALTAEVRRGRESVASISGTGRSR